MMHFRGAYTALVTPLTPDGGAVDGARLAKSIERQARAGVQGVVPCGTTGETPTLDDEEYRFVVEQTIAAARRLGIAVIPGAGANCTAHAVELHRFVARAGADAALHVTPYYNKPSQEGLYRHFMSLADAVDLPIILYNIPGRTGVALSIETIVRLAAHANIVAIKEATGSFDLAGRILERTSLTLLSGDDPLTLPLASMGGAGVVSVLGNVLPAEVAALCAACASGDFALARSIHERTLPLARALLTLDTNPVPAKTALKIMGLDTGTLRLPLCPPPREVEAELRKLLEAVPGAAETGGKRTREAARA
jgi:4-hydroxy-tetrahydrodipicolinate synthase